jgi:hypothetical protein
MAEDKFEDYVAKEAKKRGIEESRINRWLASLSHAERDALGALSGGATGIAVEYLFNPTLAEFAVPLLALPATVYAIAAIEKWHKGHSEKKLEKVM